MDVQNIAVLLQGFGVGNFKVGGQWVAASCPLAPFRHSKGVDKRPSFGISISPGGESRYRCLSCGSKGTLLELLWKMQMFTGRPYRALFDLAISSNGPSEAELNQRINEAEQRVGLKGRLSRSSYAFGGDAAEPGDHRVPTTQTSFIPREVQTIPEEHLDRLRDISDEAMAYLMGPTRKLTPLTIDVFELGWQPHTRRIVIPVRDWDGKLVGLTGRAIDPDNKPKFMHSKGFKRDLFLYGEHLVERGEIGYLVEGHFDVEWLRQMGYPNAVAMMGSYLSADQVDKIVAMFSELVIVPDGDDAGAKAAVQAEKMLAGRLPVRVADAFDGRDPNDLTQDELDDILSDPEGQTPGQFGDHLV